ncbi:hypothetical protein NDU88_000794 [Pleurodeles waltl]|uniref:Uncharacterized protein n=1 Tax=Pleurodeles waltl TaxID=8319 RepID=A0AAV7L7X9_PLEWA|nr:hypothetical protein NDU88_000794 [Pleurodeles waltl]
MSLGRALTVPFCRHLLQVRGPPLAGGLFPGSVPPHCPSGGPGLRSSPRLPRPWRHLGVAAILDLCGRRESRPRHGKFSRFPPPFRFALVSPYSAGVPISGPLVSFVIQHYLPVLY